MTIPVVKVGTEFLVNTQTSGNQVSPTIASLGNGNFVVTWQDLSGTSGAANGFSIKAQLFAADGSRIGSEFLVNTQTTSHQTSPTITGLSNGGFIVTWQDFSGTLGDNSGTSIKAQLFVADGSKVGSEFLVNSQTASFQQMPTVTSLSNGGFVATWQDLSGTLDDASGSSIKAQIFAADGSKVGAELLVNTRTLSAQTVPTVTQLTNDGFVVTWQDLSTLSDTGIKAQIFAADGSKIGAEIPVETNSAKIQAVPTVTQLANGGFVVTWQDASGTLGDTSGSSIKAQIFATDGSRVGSEFLVNMTIASDQVTPSITALKNGDFVVVWQDASGIRARVFAANGSVLGDDFLVNAQAGGSQSLPKITALENGGFAVTWQDAGGTLGDASGTGIKAQVYVLDATPGAPVLDMTSVVSEGPDTATVSGTIDLGDANLTITLVDSTLPLGSNPGAWSTTVTADANGHWTITGVPWSVIANGWTIYADDAAGNRGSSEYVYTASWADGAVLGDGKRQFVYGLSSDLVIASGAQQNVYAGGLAEGTVVRGTQINWGNASNTTIDGGIQVVWGSATVTTILTGAQHVGGFVIGTTISGGEQTIYDGGTVVHGAAQYLWGTADQTTVDGGGVQEVHGSATNTALVSTYDLPPASYTQNQQKVYFGATATATTLTGYSAQYVWGTALGTTVNIYSKQIVTGSAIDTTINYGGSVVVNPGASLHNVTFGDTGATLSLLQTSAFSGTIAGFQKGDRIDLVDMQQFKTRITSYVANADNTAGTLTISDGSHVATLALLGQYTASEFSLAQSYDGSGMISLVTSHQPALLVNPVPS